MYPGKRVASVAGRDTFVRRRDGSIHHDFCERERAGSLSREKNLNTHMWNFRGFGKTLGFFFSFGERKGEKVSFPMGYAVRA